MADAGYHPAAVAEARRRHGRALRTVAAAYLRSPSPSTPQENNDPVTTRGPRELVDRAFADLAKIRLDAGATARSSEAGMFLTLCALIRRRTVGHLDDPTRRAPSVGVVDLVDAAAATSPDEVRRVALGAYGTLDDRDRILLWFVAAEGAVPTELAARLALGDADVAATMTHRARSRLRRSYAARRIAAPEWPITCADHSRDLVRLADGDIDPVADRPVSGHARTCDRCRGLLEELTSLPGPLAVEAAVVTARIPAGRTPAKSPGRPGSDESTTTPTADAAPLVISTTPTIGDGSALPAPAAAEPGTDRSRTADRPPDPAAAPRTIAMSTDDRGPKPEEGWSDEDGDARRRGPVVAAISTAAIVLIVVVVWLAVGRHGTDTTPDDPGGGVVATTVHRVATTRPSATTRATASTTVPASTAPSTTAAPDPAVSHSTGTPAAATPAWSAPGQGSGTSPTVPPTAAPTIAPTVPPTDAPSTATPPTEPATSVASTEPDPGP